jgi:hypothetical protein
MGGAVALALVRLALIVAVASAIAALVAHLAHRSAAFGFYVVGAFVLAAAVMMSAGGVGTPYYYRHADRERRVRLSISYVVAGVLILGIAVAIDSFTR